MPSTDSIATRCIQAAEPVYHVQPPAADVRRRSVHVGRHHVRLDPIAGDLFRRLCVMHRNQHLEQPGRALGPAQLRQRTHDPKRGVRVLPAVFAHART